METESTCSSINEDSLNVSLERSRSRGAHLSQKLNVGLQHGMEALHGRSMVLIVQEVHITVELVPVKVQRA